MKIRLSNDLTLPLDAVTQAIAIVAKRRAGKSFTGRRFAEQLHYADLQLVIVDPKGDWWGIRSSADGKKPGLPIVILGGDHGDVPLEVGGGEVVAKLVVEERASILIDLSLFRKHEVATFMTAFLENLYRLKAHERYRTPVMLVIDEADAVAPQKPQPNEARMLGAAEDIVRRGGQRGIGCTLITQRSAVLNKNVLTQVQVMIALRTIAPQDLKAMNAWIDVHGTVEQRDTLMESLPALPVGDAWVWSPGWPTTDGIFLRTHILPIDTFDSGATPKPGEKRVDPKHLADVDLDALRRQMAATIERAKADDPRMLRKRIAELEAAAKKPASAGPRTKETIKVVEVPMITDKDVKRFEAACERMQKVLDKHLAEIAPYQERLNAASQQILSKMAAAMAQGRTAAIPPAVRREVTAALPKAPRAVHAEFAGGISSSQQRILDALAWFALFGIAEPSRPAIAFMADTRPTSGGFKNNLGALRGAGLLDYPREGRVALTEAGRALAVPPNVPPTNEAMQQAALDAVSGSQSGILATLIAAYPKALRREDLGRMTSTPITSGGFKNNLGALRTLELVDYPSAGEVVATKVLFPMESASG